MKVRVIYTESFEIDINADEVEVLLDLNGVDDPTADDATIRAAIAEYADGAITDREWPAYRLEIDDELLESAREVLAKPKDEGETP